MPSIAGGRDDALAIPTLPHAVPLDLDLAVSAFREAPAAAPFLLSGSSARLHAGAAGVDDAWCSGLHVLASVRVAGAVPEATHSSPVALTRVLHLPAGDVVETLMVPGGASAAVIEWRALADVSLEISWRATVDGAAGDALRWNHDASGVIAARGAARAAWMLTANEPADIVVSEDGDALCCTARVAVAAGDCCRLVCIAVATGSTLVAELAPLREPQSLALARIAEQRRRLRTELVIETGHAPVDAALHRALQRVDTHARAFAQSPPNPADWEAAAWTALARAAAGNPEPALALLRHLGAHMAGQASAPLSRAVCLLLATECTAWTGSAGAARRAWPVILQSLDAVAADIERSADARAAILRAAALARLPHVAELLGDTAGGQRAQALAPRARQAAIAAAQNAGGDAAALAVALRVVEADPAAAPAREYADTALTAWAELVAGRATGPARLERVLAGRGAARAGDADALESAFGVLGATAGLLGLGPDAASGRLTVRPVFPPHWKRVRIGSIRLGDWTLGFTRSQEPGSDHFELRPVEGATPLTVIFEPLLAGRLLLAADVDGTAAALDTTPVGDRIRVSVQIVLDHSRTIRFTSE